MIRKLLSPCALTISLAAGCGAAPELEAVTPEAGVEQGAQTLLGTTKDQCSGQLRVLNSDGNLITIARGVRTRVNVSDYRFRWYCGGSAEFTTCDVGTRYVYVIHSTSSRDIYWACHY